eukprot:1049641-Prymnesium_polylepis.1
MQKKRAVGRADLLSRGTVLAGGRGTSARRTGLLNEQKHTSCAGRGVSDRHDRTRTVGTCAERTTWRVDLLPRGTVSAGARGTRGVCHAKGKPRKQTTWRVDLLPRGAVSAGACRPEAHAQEARRLRGASIYCRGE